MALPITPVVLNRSVTGAVAPNAAGPPGETPGGI